MAFLNLPNEILVLITSHCSDKDICKLATTCKNLHSFLLNSENSLWRLRFLNVFDSLPPTAGTAYMIEYKKRFTWHSYFAHGNGQILEWQLIDPSVLVQVAIEAQFDGFGRTSKNMKYLEEMLERSEILHNTFMRTWPLRDRAEAQTLQLLFWHQGSDFFRKHRVSDFETAQQVAYGNPDTAPLFSHDSRTATANLRAFLHLSMFFKAHYTLQGEIRHCFDRLAYIERPQAWTRPLKESRVQPLGVNWRGSCVASLDLRDLLVVRRGFGAVELVKDTFEAVDRYGTDSPDSDGFDDMVLSFEPAHQPTRAWPRSLLRALNMLECRKGSPPPPECLPFVGSARMGVDSLVAGFITPAAPIGGVTGWQRVAFVTYADDEFTDDSSTNNGLFGLLARAGKVPRGRSPRKGSAEDSIDVARYIPSAASCKGAAATRLRVFVPDETLFLTWPQLPRQQGRAGTFDVRSIDRAVLEGLVRDHNRFARCEYREIVADAVSPTAEEAKWWADTPYRVPDPAADIVPLVPASRAFAFEGLVWPGGNVMMGRWWNLADDVWDDAKGDWVDRGTPEWRPETAPFCFWCTDLGYEWEDDYTSELETSTSVDNRP